MKLEGTGTLIQLGKAIYEKADQLVRRGKYKSMAIAERKGEQKLPPAEQQAHLEGKSHTANVSVPTAPKVSEKLLENSKRKHQQHAAPKGGYKDVHLKTRRDDQGVKLKQALNPSDHPDRFNFTQFEDGNWVATPKDPASGAKPEIKAEYRRDRLLESIEKHEADRQEGIGQWKGGATESERREEMKAAHKGKYKYQEGAYPRAALVDAGRYGTYFEDDKRMSAVMDLENRLDNKFMGQRAEMLLNGAKGKVFDCQEHKTRTEKLFAKVMKFVTRLKETKIFRGKQLPDQLVNKLSDLLTSIASKNRSSANKKLKQAEANLWGLQHRLEMNNESNLDSSAGDVSRMRMFKPAGGWDAAYYNDELTDEPFDGDEDQLAAAYVPQSRSEEPVMTGGDDAAVLLLGAMRDIDRDTSGSTVPVEILVSTLSQGSEAIELSALTAVIGESNFSGDNGSAEEETNL
ncbi:hypothetical protein [Parendozoicomonas sp. Alg238-R29]|uniref:hypothetical protein n=1 Tax=Parendozoicomonas sp. Alg238-R29 TaxID=2993446 RepID=UPI00248D7D3C|nr:hypothetical protein [Parendozoicomonas sp. Alg238-R29]